MKRFKNLIIALVTLLLLFPLQPVRADMAPPPAPWLTGLEPFEYANTKVQMMYERVEMEMQDFHDPNNSDANMEVLVTASFLMRNQGTTTETMQSIFPADTLTSCAGSDSIDPNSFEITVDGATVPTQEVITPHPYKGDDRLIYPEACSEMRWVGFNVTFPVDTDVVVIVKYRMKAVGYQTKNIEYVLETGAAWYGPIKQADIIARFPYTVSQENILEGTTAGYKLSYNEVLWSYKNIEPTHDDNIQITMVAPNIWQSIYTMREMLKENPTLSKTWSNLIGEYASLVPSEAIYNRAMGYRQILSPYYYKLIEPTYQQAIASNPNNADLHAFYANFLINQCCVPTIRKIKDADLDRVLKQVNLALALDPNNSTAHMVAANLMYLRDGLTLTPPPTIPATATPAVSETPTATASATLEPEATSTIVVRLMLMTVVQTRIVTATPANTALPTVTPAPSQTPTPDVVFVKGISSVLDWLLWLGLLLVGFVGGALVVQKKKP